MLVDKSHIVAEIQRTAVENEGRPLGELRFRSETGIRPSDWKGIHWIRWSDALKEAGFAPNKFGRSHQKEVLLQSYAMLARELGRLPVDADLLMKRRNSRDFPERLSFRRYGGKQKLVQMV